MTLFLIDENLIRKKINKIVMKNVFRAPPPQFAQKKTLGFPRATLSEESRTYWFFFMLFITARICASEGLRPI
jgi:hypothetical protein